MGKSLRRMIFQQISYVASVMAGFLVALNERNAVNS